MYQKNAARQLLLKPLKFRIMNENEIREQREAKELFLGVIIMVVVMAAIWASLWIVSWMG